MDAWRERKLPQEATREQWGAISLATNNHPVSIFAKTAKSNEFGRKIRVRLPTEGTHKSTKKN